MNLNLIDIDFLESMGMTSTATATDKKFVGPPKVDKPAEPKIVNDPNAILAKLNDKNSQFISAYNVYAMNTREK